MAGFDSKPINYLERPTIVDIVIPETGEKKRALEGKRAIVTGGGKGIGKGVSIRLAEAGASVVIVGNSNMTMAEETRELIESRGGKAYTIGIDLSKPESAAKVVEFAVEKMGGIDILVNNAAFQPNLDIVEYSADVFQNVIDVNLISYLRMTMAAFPYLKECGEGRIINVGSVHSKRPTGFDFAYAVSKGGVLMLTRETATAFRPYGITCNAILPGGTAIEFKTKNPEVVKPNEGPDRKRESFAKSAAAAKEKEFRSPGCRVGYPSDTGNLTVFFASGVGEHYNGVAVRADGGMMLF